jgi:acetyl-CoA carboxylase biotin carboxyl carrier protein
VATKLVKSEITGKVWKIEAKVGQRVELDDILLLIESMKMEIPVLASASGVIEQFLVQEDDDVVDGQNLVAIQTGR